MSRIDGPPRIFQPPVKRELTRRLGKTAASRLFNLLQYQHSRFFVKLYQAGGPVDINGRKYMYDGMKNSPIVLGDQRDLSYYQVEAEHPDFPQRGRQTLAYLEKYLLIPTRSGKLIFVSDTHNHALFGWALARELGLTDQNSALVHVDAHYDDGIPSYAGAGVKVRLSQEALDCIYKPVYEYEEWGRTQNSRVLHYSEADGLLRSEADAFTLELFAQDPDLTAKDRQAFRELHEHRRQYETGRPGFKTLEDFRTWSRGYADIASFITPGKEVLFDEVLFVLSKENGLQHDHHRGSLDGYRQGGQIVSIELMRAQLQQLKAQGRKIILDLDLDYFAHYFQEEADSGAEAKERVTFEDNFQQVIALAREADFITVATSPDWFADQAGIVRQILERFIMAMP